MVGSTSTPPLTVVPVILILFLSFLSFSSSVLSQSISISIPESDFGKSYLASSPSTHTTCTVTPLSLTATKPQGTIYLYNITYYSITMPPTAPEGFTLEIRYNDNRDCVIDAFVGDDSDTCPDEKKHFKSSSGGYIDFSLLNHTTNTYYIGLRATNCSSLQVTFQINTVCPSFCSGPGAHCSTSIGCFCLNNYYDPLGGCFITGPCDPTSKYQYTCAAQFGYGNQTCHIDHQTNFTYLGVCKIARCNAGYILDSDANTCRRGLPPPPPDPPKPNSIDETSPWWQVGSLGKAASISIWCAEALGALVVLSAVVFVIIRKGRSNTTNNATNYTELAVVTRKRPRNASAYAELGDERL